MAWSARRRGPAVGCAKRWVHHWRLAVAKSGLSKSPVRLLLLVNVVLWSVTCLFSLRSSVILLAAGMAVYMVLLPMRKLPSRPSFSRSCRSSGKVESSGSHRASNRPHRH